MSRPNILSILPTIQEIENLYYQYIFAFKDDVVFPPSSLDIALGTLRFMRYYVYNGVQWFGTTFALSDPGFVNYVSNNSPEVFNTMFEYISTSKLLTDNANGQVELPHLSVTTECYISASIIPDFWAGWGGDLASVMPEVASESSLDYFQTACSKVGANNSYFNYADICMDADAITLASMIMQSSSEVHALSESLLAYYSGMQQNRYNSYIEDIGCSKTLTSIKNKLREKNEQCFCPTGLKGRKPISRNHQCVL